MVVDGATARERLNGEREKEQELTAVPVGLTASSGTHWRRRGGEDDLQWPEMMTTAMEAPRGAPACVAEGDDAGQRRGARGHDERARGRW